MKTFATTLLLLASATAAYGHSPKASKADISNNLSYSFIQSKSTKKSSSKTYKEPIRGRRLLGEDHAGGIEGGKPERNLHHKTSMSYHLFRVAKTAKTKSEKDVVLFSASAKSEKEAVAASVSAKSSKARFGRALHKRSELDLIEGSLSLELSPRTYPKSGKAAVFVIDAKSSKAVPVKVKRSIDPVDVEEVSNDQAEPTKALSFIEYRSQTATASKEEASGASVLAASVAAGTLLAVSVFALN